MSNNRVVVKLNYDAYLLIDVDDLPTLMNILQGATIIDNGFIGKDYVHYIKNKVYNLEISDTGNRLYITEDEYNRRREEFDAQEESDDEAF